MSVGGVLTSWKHGTNGAISTNTDFSTKTFSVSPDFSAENVDQTTFQSTYRSKEQSFKNGTIQAVYKYDTTIYGQLAAIYNGGDTITFEFGPDGTTTGKPKVTGSMFITNFGTPVTVGDRIELSVSFETSGAITFTTFA
jgi:hypothetical protein